MNTNITIKVAHATLVLVALVCMVLSGCGRGAQNTVDQKVAGSNESTAKVSALPANAPNPTTVSSPTANTVKATPNNVKANASNDPKPEIGTGGSDFFQFTQARAAIGGDPDLKTTNILIDVKAGVLTLSGTVASAQQKSKAEQLVRAVDGIKTVNNRLRISN
jgi:hyperosmotically inducible periplasmic protein